MRARGSFALAVHADGPVTVSANSAFADGIHTGLLYAAGAALLAAVTVAVLLADGLRSRAARPPVRVGWPGRDITPVRD